MQASLTKHLLLISLLFGLGGCAVPKHLNPLKHGKKEQLSDQNFKPIFKDDFKSFLFKTSMSYGDKFELGGMLALKQLSVGNFRAVFMTKFGMTMFDFEFGDQGFIVHKALEQMNKKIFLKIIEQDIEMLLMRNILGNDALFFEKGKIPRKQHIIKAPVNKKPHYFVQERHQHVTEIHRGQQVSVKLSKYIANIPRSIHIQHHNMPLTMKLTLLKH